MRRVLMMVAALLSLAGCTFGKDVATAEAAIAEFHQMLDAGRFEDIYTGSSADLKKAATPADLIQLLSIVHDRLGPFTSGKSAGWNDNRTTTGHFVTINYSAIYQRGAADENFVYRIDDGHARLVGYHINSNALLAAPRAPAPMPTT